MTENRSKRPKIGFRKILHGRWVSGQVESHIESSETYLCDRVADLLLFDIPSTTNEMACESMNVLLYLLH